MRKILMPSTLLSFTFTLQPLVDAKEPSESVIYLIKREYEIPNLSPWTATDVTATIYLLDNRSGWASQTILEEDITLNGSSISPEIITTLDNRLAHVELNEIADLIPQTIRVIKIVKVDAHPNRCNHGIGYRPSDRVAPPMRFYRSRPN